MSTTEVISLKLSRYIKAPAERIFTAWSTPDQVMRWMGPDTCQLLAAEIDFRVGGAYKFRMKTETMGVMNIKGVYREIVKPSKIVFTWTWVDDAGDADAETLVTVEVEPVQDGCRVVLTHEGFQSAESRDNHIKGWTGCLDKLERRAEAVTEMCMPGHFHWNELLAPSVEGAGTFYSKLFGWEAVPAEGMPYVLFKQKGTEVGGLMKTPVDGMPAHWQAYVTVENVDASHAAAVGLGATSCAAPFDIPGVGRIAVLLDPQGAKFGIFQPGK